MQAQTVGNWLDGLASEAPSPGGGAAAALSAATGAALVSMVCNLTIGKPKYAAHEPTMTRVLERATRLRGEALRLAEQDAGAFDAVIAAYRMPKDTDAQRQARSDAVQAALAGAADVPLRTATVAAEIVTLGEEILDGANVNVLSDIAVAAAAARAALDAAAVNVEVNLAALADTGYRADLAGRLGVLLEATPRAEALIARVRARISA